MAFLRKYKLTIHFPEIKFTGGIFEGTDLQAVPVLGPQDAIILKKHQISFTVEKTNKNHAFVPLGPL